VLSRRLLVSPAPGQGVEGCADVVFYGVRGAFERYDMAYTGMGPTVAGVAERSVALLKARGSTIRVTRIGVAYPANTWIYFTSRRVGSTRLSALLATAAERCPDQRFVMVGLSQGAEVIRRTLRVASNDITRRIAAVVLLGDPTRRPTDPWQHGTADASPGVASRTAATVPSELHNRMWGYTLDGDEIAANHLGLRGLFRSGTHTLYEHNHESVQDLAAAFIAEKLAPPSLDPTKPQGIASSGGVNDRPTTNHPSDGGGCVRFHPSVEAQGGLDAALAVVAAEFAAQGMEVIHSLGSVDEPSPEVTAALVEAIREALQNVAMHADTQTAVVRADTAAGRLTVTVRDQGRGFDPDTTSTALGLREALASRLAEVDGKAEIWSKPGRGTRVTLSVPAS
jgi:hypothetical protein